jgi:hypothetical protein
MHWASPTLTIRLGLIMLGIGMLLTIGRRSIREIMSAAQRIMLGELKATSTGSIIAMSRT